MTELNKQLLTQLVQVKRHYQAVDAKMRGLPLYHPDLSIEVIPHGRVPFESDQVKGEGLLAGVMTPWCLNAVLIPLVWPLHWPHHVGAELSLKLPSETYVMLLNKQGFLTLSLLATPRQLEDMQAAQVFLRTALTLLASAPESDMHTPPPNKPSTLNRPVSRRGLLRHSP